MRPRWLVLLLTLAVPASARDRIAFIEYFGYQGIDIEAVRKALPIQEGDAMSGSVRAKVEEAVKRVTGSDATDVALVCCVNDQDGVVFIGLPGTSSHSFPFRLTPKQNLRLPAELIGLYRQMRDAESAAILKGAAQEDGLPGYRLMKDPAARAAELRVREYAIQHETELVAVLENSAIGEQRAQAADVLGFGKRTDAQLAALVQAARDSEEEVRNNATRALGEIVAGDLQTAALLPTGAFIDMIRSGSWTDRNKASLLLGSLTMARDPRLLNRLRAEAWDALMEMARWRTTGWSSQPRMILARIAGIPEERVAALAEGPLDAFLAAIKR